MDANDTENVHFISSRVVHAVAAVCCSDTLVLAYQTTMYLHTEYHTTNTLCSKMSNLTLYASFHHTTQTLILDCSLLTFHVSMYHLFISISRSEYIQANDRMTCEKLIGWGIEGSCHKLN